MCDCRPENGVNAGVHMTFKSVKHDSIIRGETPMWNQDHPTGHIKLQSAYLGSRDLGYRSVSNFTRLSEFERLRSCGPFYVERRRDLAFQYGVTGAHRSHLHVRLYTWQLD